MSADVDPGVVADDILAAVAGYLAEVQGQSLLSPGGNPQVFVDYLPSTNPDGTEVVPPYAMVTEGPESYGDAQSESTASGYQLTVIAEGTCLLNFIAPTKAQARSLCRVAVLRMSDTVARLATRTGRVVTLLPLRSHPVPNQGPGPSGEPAAFHRVLTVLYKEQFAD